MHIAVDEEQRSVDTATAETNMRSAAGPAASKCERKLRPFQCIIRPIAPYKSTLRSHELYS